MRNSDWRRAGGRRSPTIWSTCTPPRGVESKGEHVGNLKAGKPHYRGIAPRDRKARVRGDVGIVNGVSEMHVENAGKEQRFTVRYLAVYAKAGSDLADDRLAVDEGAGRLSSDLHQARPTTIGPW